MSIEFDTPANRIISQFQPKNQFRIDTSLPDIAFLRQLSVQGRMRYFFGTRNATVGNIITITPSIGDTFFLLHAQIASLQNSIAQVDLINDGVKRVELSAGLGGGGTVFLIGIDSLVGDGTKTMTMNNTVGVAASANMVGWIENTSRIRDPAT